MEYRNKEGLRFDITISHGDVMAFVDGKFVATAEDETELKKILDHLSHATPNNTARYLGLQKEETAD